MTLYEAWKGRRNQIQGLLVEDLSDYSREEWERGRSRGKVVKGHDKDIGLYSYTCLYLLLPPISAETCRLIGKCFDAFSGCRDIRFLYRAGECGRTSPNRPTSEMLYYRTGGNSMVVTDQLGLISVQGDM